MLLCWYSTKKDPKNERESAMAQQKLQTERIASLKVRQKEKQGLLQEKTKGLLHLCRMWAGDRRRQKQPGKGAGQRPPG